MQAIDTFKLDPDVYFSKPRDRRMAMVAYVISKNALHAMQSYDEGKRAEAKAKSKRKR